MKSKSLFLWGAALGTLSQSGAALASPPFPSALRAAADMECTPSCAVCHTTDPGRSGTAGKGFAIAMAPQGTDEDALFTAYENLADDVDTDADGVPDKAELMASPPTDPNAPGEASICTGEVEYGCGAHVASVPQKGNGWPWLLAGVSGLCVAFLRLRGRKPLAGQPLSHRRLKSAD